ncbi:MAG: lysostaphin resistance A-like protein [Clostridiaceae bacterium]
MDNKKTGKVKSIGNILLIIIAFFGLVILGEIIVLGGQVIFYIIKGYNLENIISKLTAISTEMSLEMTILMAVVQNIMTIIVVLLFLKGKFKNRIISLSLDVKNNSLKLFLQGGFCGFIGIIFIVLIGVLIGVTKFEGFGIYSFGHGVYMLFLSLITFIFVGFGEEIFFRGYIFNRLKESGGYIWSIIMSSLIFMIFHIGTYSKLLDFIDVFLAGIILVSIYIITDSLWMPIGFHFVWDFTQSFIVRIEDIPMSFSTVLNFKVPGNFYINGYNFGCSFELIFILFEFLFLALLFYKYKKIKSNIKGENNENTIID